MNLLDHRIMHVMKLMRVAQVNDQALQHRYVVSRRYPRLIAATCLTYRVLCQLYQILWRIVSRVVFHLPSYLIP